MNTRPKLQPPHADACMSLSLCRAQDDGVLGLVHGLYIGTSGIILKPLSGSLDCVAKLCTGVGGSIRAWGDDVARGPPRARVRPPRLFSALASDAAGARARPVGPPLEPSKGCMHVHCTGNWGLAAPYQHMPWLRLAACIETTCLHRLHC